MFPLFTRSFPESARELEEALNASLRRAFFLKTDPVQVEDSAFPHVAAIRVALEGATVRQQLPRPPQIAGSSAPAAIRVDHLSIRANAVAIGPGSANLVLEARDVTLSRANDANGEIILTLQRAHEGSIAISAATRALEAAITEVAKSEANKHGVTIDEVRLSARSSGARAISVEARVRARKMFLGAAIRVAGHLEIDDELNAKVSGLTCDGEGAIAAVACGVLRAQLQKIDGRAFSLLALPLGEVRLHDVQIAAGETVSIQAQFGSA